MPTYTSSVIHRGRLDHGRHFTFRSLHGDVAITLMTDGVEGAIATHAQPFIAQGPWLQVYLGKDSSKKVLADIDMLLNSSKHQPPPLPLSLEWQDIQLRLTVC